jgi:hypothetical protein
MKIQGFGFGRKANDLALYRIIVMKSKEVKTGCNLRECSRKSDDNGYITISLNQILFLVVFYCQCSSIKG